MADENGNVGVFTLLGGVAIGILGILAIKSMPEDTGENIATALGEATGAVIEGLSSLGTKLGNGISSIMSNNKVKTSTITGASTVVKRLTQTKKQPIVFPINPYRFNPKGLTMEVYPGTDNGAIIKWKNSIGVAKFEWNEDFENGAHYHITPNGSHKIGIGKMHFKPLTKIPEPYRSIYFY